MLCAKWPRNVSYCQSKSLLQCGAISHKGIRLVSTGDDYDYEPLWLTVFLAGDESVLLNKYILYVARKKCSFIVISRTCNSYSLNGNIYSMSYMWKFCLTCWHNMRAMLLVVALQRRWRPSVFLKLSYNSNISKTHD